jgi:hypothetical protein
MKPRLHAAICAVLSLAFASTLAAQGPPPYSQPAYPPPPPSSPLQPPGVPEAFMDLASQQATHTAVVFDREMIQGIMNTPTTAALNSITFESYRYREPAFYTPEGMAQLTAAYQAAGWHHLVNANTTPRDSAMPQKPITDMWLHFHDTDIDGCTVVIRAPRQMNVIEVSGVFRPLDLLKLGGHFGIPKVDPNAIMVPDPR